MRAADDRRDLWSFGNAVLYDLCRNFPNHTRSSQVTAKVWLIGRAYSAAVERGVARESAAPRDTTRFYRLRIARPIRLSGIDRHIAKLRTISRLDVKNAPFVLATHARLVDVLAKSIRKRKRSFASKYLHFHAPIAVPIYDSIAAGSLRERIPNRRRLPRSFRGYDPAYAMFVGRYLQFRDDIVARFGLDLSPRQLDRLLWKPTDQ